MNCPHCEYLLFNLPQPVCPECGQGFDLAGFRFDLGSVSFHCPHCDQAYYGNDEQGLPSPRAFSCVTCGQALTLQELKVVPRTPEVRARRPAESPWDTRDQLGTVRAWWKTVGMTLVKPHLFFRNHSGQSTRESWLFGMISMYVGLVPYLAFNFLVLWGVTKMLTAVPVNPAGPPAGAAALPVLPIKLMGAAYGVIAVVGPLIGPFVYGAVAACWIHLALLVLAPHRKPMGHTFRAAMYSLGPYALYAVPGCGASVAGIWQLVTLVIAVREVHGISGWRAAIAVLWPIAIVIVLYVVIFAFILSNMPRGGLFPGTPFGPAAPMPAPSGVGP